MVKLNRRRDITNTGCILLIQSSLTLQTVGINNILMEISSIYELDRNSHYLSIIIRCKDKYTTLTQLFFFLYNWASFGGPAGAFPMNPCPVWVSSGAKRRGTPGHAGRPLAMPLYLSYELNTYLLQFVHAIYEPHIFCQIIRMNSSFS